MAKDLSGEPDQTVYLGVRNCDRRPLVPQQFVGLVSSRRRLRDLSKLVVELEQTDTRRTQIVAEIVAVVKQIYAIPNPDPIRRAA